MAGLGRHVAAFALLPFEQRVLEPRHDVGDRHAEQREQRQHTHYAIHVESRLQIREGLPKPVFRRKQLGADDAEHGVYEAEPKSGKHHRHRGGQRYLEEELPRSGAQRTRKDEMVLVHAPDAGHGAR